MYSIVLVTTKNQTEAKKISKVLLEEKLVACVNIIKNIESLFWWQGKIDKATEALLIIKTKKTKIKKLIKKIKSVHSYDVPEIIALPIIEGNPDYLKWIESSVGK